MKIRAVPILFFLFLPFCGFGKAALPKAPDVRGKALQEGAELFVDYCSGCLGLSFVRRDQFAELGFSEKRIGEMMITDGYPGQPMRPTATREDQKLWFGAVPPDLSLAARARASEKGSGADWLTAYLRSFRRDESRPTGWNNDVFANVAMPHVLWEMQGAESPAADGRAASTRDAARAGEYERRIAGLVGFLVWASDPSAAFRKRVGIGVVAFLLVFSAMTLALKKEYCREIENERD
ncbi:MAG: cytochrome c1 [Candidatus Accumulibacter sp.]|nr:cytochrome c1 [Accumulibacter sp.]